MAKVLFATELHVRQLRDNVYGKCTDKNWEMCKEPTDKSLGWMHPENVQWLLDQRQNRHLRNSLDTIS